MVSFISIMRYTLASDYRSGNRLMTHAGVSSTLPSEKEARLAGETSRVLASRIHRKSALRMRIVEGSKESEVMSLPPYAVRLLLDILEEMSRGNGVTLLPVQAELTTQEAADLLQVSRPYVVQLLEEGKMPHHKVGAHRRVLFEDVMAYKQKIDQKRRAALDELAKLDQALGLE